MKNLLTVIIVSFHSENIIENAIKSINRKKYKNITVLNSMDNLGFGRSINLAIQKIKTPFSFYLSADAVLKKKSLEYILNYAVKNTDWVILTPSIINTVTPEINIIKKNYKKDIDSINFTPGCAFFFNKKVIKKIGGFDKNIFLYYEDHDFFLRCLKTKKKILVINKASVLHKGNSSVDKKFNYEIELNRNWHLMWSKFYFYKKNFSIITAYKKTLRSFFSSIIKIIYYKFINERKYFIYLNRFNGLLSSYMNKKSSRRPKTN
jgi:GT2 family glycosyltransferase